MDYLSAGQLGAALFFSTAATSWVLTFLEFFITKRLSRSSKEDDVELQESKTAILNGKGEHSRGEHDGHSTRAAVVEHPIPDQRTAFKTACQMFTEVGMILLYTYLCENRPLHPHGDRVFNRDHFWFIFGIFLLFCFAFPKKASSSSLVNRDQTEEWKGWMQFLFVAYHYFKATETYNFIRILVACYVWMTGFGNFSFFYIKKDFSFLRMIRMLWRLNFLTIFLCLVLNNGYSLYYITGLHTFWFFVVYGTMWVASSKNDWQGWFLSMKLMGVMMLAFFLWDIPEVFQHTFGLLVRGDFAKHETHFRTYLDHYVPIFGMLYANNYPRFSDWVDHVEKLRPSARLAIKGCTTALMLTGLGLWATFVLPVDKLTYNGLHPYYSWIPIMAYCWLRNLSPTLRGWYLGPMAFWGKLSLESYLMQHHIWLSSNAKTVLVMLPDYPELNFLLTSAIFVFVAWKIRHLTEQLCFLVLPNDTKIAVRYLNVFGFALVACVAAGALLIGLPVGTKIFAGIIFAVTLSVALRFLVAENVGLKRTAIIMLSAVFVVLAILHGAAIWRTPTSDVEFAVKDDLAAKTRHLLADAKEDVDHGPVTPPAPPKTDFVGCNPKLGMLCIAAFAIMVLGGDNLWIAIASTRWFVGSK